MYQKVTLTKQNYLRVKKNVLKIGAIVLSGFLFISSVNSQTYYSNFTNASGHQTSTPSQIVDPVFGVVKVDIGSFSNPAFVADDPITNFSSYSNSFSISLLSGGSVNVKSDLNLGNNVITNNNLKAGSTAGFVIDNNNMIDISVANTVTVTTYLNNVLQESSTTTNLMGTLFPSLSTTAQDFHFTTTKSFNQIGITIGSGVIGISAFTNIKFYYAYGIGATVLPVSLTSFNAVSEGKTIKLGWATASESNNKGFTVERSTDAVNFSQIGYVASQAVNGNSGTTLNYVTRDESPLAGTNYYRLTQIDIDGHRTPSIIVSANSVGGAVTAFKVFPNPATNLINIEAPLDGTYLVELFTIDGKKIQTSQLSTGGGLLNFNINKLGVKSGIYSIKVTNINGKSSSFYNTVLIK